MHAYLIFSPNQTAVDQKLQEILKELQISLYDQMQIEPEENSITVMQIRQSLHQINLSPMGDKKAIIIKPADVMTIEAQNALLKTLEEPPPRVVFFLLTTQKEALLPTIVSRCQTVNLISEKNTLDPHIYTYIKTYLQSTYKDKLVMHDTVGKDKQAAINWLTNLTQVLDMQGRENPTIYNEVGIKACIDGLKRLTVNCNPKVVLDLVGLKIQN